MHETSAIKNKYFKLENSQAQIENPDYRKNKIKIKEMNQNIRKLANVTNIIYKRQSTSKKENRTISPNADKGGKLTIEDL